MRMKTCFYEGQVKQQMLYICFLSHLKWWSSSSRRHQILLNFDDSKAFPQIQQTPGPDFRKVGKSLKGNIIVPDKQIF